MGDDDSEEKEWYNLVSQNNNNCASSLPIKMFFFSDLSSYSKKGSKVKGC